MQDDREWIRERGLALGFHAVGFARAPGPDEPFVEGQRLREWLGRGLHAGMDWMARSARRRADPHAMLSGLRSVVACAWRYPAAGEPGPGEGRVAAYARGRDYHNVLGPRARKLLFAILERHPGAEGLSFVDRAAVLEKAWAVRAGLGWLGKNTLVLHPQWGSTFLLAVLFLTLDLEPDPIVPDQCGACRLCLDACPTGAFAGPWLLDARRCLSYLTIEHRGPIPPDLEPALGDRLFGCDDCQDVCPYNRRPLAALDPAFGPDSTPLHEPLGPLLEADDAGFVRLTRGRPLARPGRDGLLRNAAAVAASSGDPAWLEPLERLAGDRSAVVRAAAESARARLARTVSGSRGAGPQARR